MLRLIQLPALADEGRLLNRILVHVFGDTYFFRKELGIPNVLSGYSFLLDKKGRIRWTASGLASTQELFYLVSCISRLLEEDSKGSFSASSPPSRKEKMNKEG